MVNFSDILLVTEYHLLDTCRADLKSQYGDVSERMYSRISSGTHSMEASSAMLKSSSMNASTFCCSSSDIISLDDIPVIRPATSNNYMLITDSTEAGNRHRIIHIELSTSITRPDELLTSISHPDESWRSITRPDDLSTWITRPDELSRTITTYELFGGGSRLL